MKNKYCDIQENCKLLIQTNTQYNLVVKQNKSLQADLRIKNKQFCIAEKWLKNIAAEPIECDYATETKNLLLHIKDKVNTALKEIEVANDNRN